MEKYPFVFAKIPVLVREPIKYLANNIIKYWKYTSTIMPRPDHVEEYHAALSENRKLFEELTDSLAQPLHLNDMRETLQSLDATQLTPYSFFTGYLMRDWAGDAEGEKEISTITNAVRKGLTSQSRVLVLGAGLGRLACELTDLFEQVVAIDYEPNMPFFFQKLRNGGFTFADIHLDNADTEAEKIRWITFSDAHTKQLNLQKVDYLIADAREIPFEDQYFDAVVSVYFTDVLPIKPMLKEIKRVLRPGGTFAHFGPLEYHFADVSRKYSFEAFIEILRDLNFTIRDHERVELAHCQPLGGAAFEIFKNWNLHATLNSDPAISGLSFVVPAEDVTFSITGTIKAVSETSVTIHVRDQEPIKISQEMFDVIKCAEGGCTVSQIMERLEKNFSYDSPDEEVIRVCIESLVSNGILNVRP